MSATVVSIADVVTAKQTPLDGDIEVIVGRAKLHGNTVYVAFPGARFAAALFWVESSSPPATPQLQIPKAWRSQTPPTIRVWGASPDGSGALVQLDANLRVLLEAYSIPLTELEIPLKSVGGTTAYARGSDPQMASQPNDSLHEQSLALVLRVGAAGADREATALVEYPILEALAILGSTAREFQGPDEIPRSLELQLSSHFLGKSEIRWTNLSIFFKRLYLEFVFTVQLRVYLLKLYCIYYMQDRIAVHTDMQQSWWSHLRLPQARGLESEGQWIWQGGLEGEGHHNRGEREHCGRALAWHLGTARTQTSPRNLDISSSVGGGFSTDRRASSRALLRSCFRISFSCLSCSTC